MTAYEKLCKTDKEKKGLLLSMEDLLTRKYQKKNELVKTAYFGMNLLSITRYPTKNRSKKKHHCSFLSALQGNRATDEYPAVLH